MSENNIGRKALYNLLRINWLEDSTMEVESWQVQDYRKLSTSQLFAELQACGISCNHEQFTHYLEQAEHPEQLADTLTPEESPAPLQDRIYLNVFELWRRLAQHKPSLVIFADELDHQVFLYDAGESEREDLCNVLEYFLEILEGSPDPEEFFQELCAECGHDIEAFLYDYLADELDRENYLYVSGFLDRIYDCIPYKAPFDFLRVRLQSVSDVDLAQELLEQVLGEIDDNPDFDLALEVLRYLVQVDEKEQFMNLARALCEQVETADDLSVLLEVSQEGVGLAKKAEISALAEDVAQAPDQWAIYKERFEEILGASPTL